MLCLIITIIPCKDFIAMVQFETGFKAEARGRSAQEEDITLLSPFSSRASSLSDSREEGASSGESQEAVYVLMCEKFSYLSDQSQITDVFPGTRLATVFN